MTVKFIGITGGVGAGKSAILSYLAANFSCRVELADLVAHKVMEKGQSCFNQVLHLLGDTILDENGCIDRKKMGEVIFRDKEKLERVNQIIHPAVKQFIMQEVEKERKLQKIEYFFLEAALLIEDGYATIVDELWYIYTREEIRTERLKEQRGYNDLKIRMIMDKQLPEEEFRKQCKFIIDNNETLQHTFQQIDRRLLESSDNNKS